MNSKHTETFVQRIWEESIVPELIEYIRIPCKSPAFDPQWQAHGHIEEALRRIEQWCRQQPIPGMTLRVLQHAGQTPLLYLDIPGASQDCVLLYGHLDKQPEMMGWRAGLGPWTPVLEGERLYGRGGADDGYAVFASLAAIEALQVQNIPHARCVVIIEACEESGSYNLPTYIEDLSDQIGRPGLVICLDSGCGNYDQLWCTTSLRGLVTGDLRIQVLQEGVHSGDASGIVPSSWRILRQLLNRLEEDSTGRILPSALHEEIPLLRQRQAEQAASILGEEVYRKFPLVEGGQPVTLDLRELVLNRTWRPALSVTGAAGLPALADAGNVLRPMTTVRLSLRLPPTCDANAAATLLKVLLERDPPYGAQVTFQVEGAASGWEAPVLEPWLAEAVDKASRRYFGREAVYMGEGGSIPFMDMLGKRFPDAQFLITGVLGPHSNAHGPNEFLHLPAARKLTCCIAQVLQDHYRSTLPAA